MAAHCNTVECLHPKLGRSLQHSSLVTDAHAARTFRPQARRSCDRAWLHRHTCCHSPTRPRTTLSVVSLQKQSSPRQLHLYFSQRHAVGNSCPVGTANEMPLRQIIDTTEHARDSTNELRPSGSTVVTTNSFLQSPACSISTRRVSTPLSMVHGKGQDTMMRFSCGT